MMVVHFTEPLRRLSEMPEEVEMFLNRQEFVPVNASMKNLTSLACPGPGEDWGEVECRPAACFTRQSRELCSHIAYILRSKVLELHFFLPAPSRVNDVTGATYPRFQVTDTY